jgi:hypothetical protein
MIPWEINSSPPYEKDDIYITIVTHGLLKHYKWTTSTLKCLIKVKYIVLRNTLYYYYTTTAAGCVSKISVSSKLIYMDDWDFSIGMTFDSRMVLFVGIP